MQNKFKNRNREQDEENKYFAEENKQREENEEVQEDEEEQDNNLMTSNKSMNGLQVLNLKKSSLVDKNLMFFLRKVTVCLQG